MEKSIIIVVVLAALAGIAVWFMMPKGGEAVSSNDVVTSAPAPAPANDTPVKDTSTTPQKDTSAPKAVAMTISMSEFSFTVDGQAANGTITLDAGKTYAITFVDSGAVGHEAKIGKGDMIKRDNGTPNGYTDNFYADVSAVLTKNDASKTSGKNDSAASSSTLEEVELDAGESATITFTVPDSLAGQTFEIGCFVPGHYEAGMKASVVIK